MNCINDGTAILKITYVFDIANRGCVVAGEQQKGVFHMGDKVIIYRDGVAFLETKIIGIEVFTRNTNCPALLLRRLNKNEIMENDLVIKFHDSR